MRTLVLLVAIVGPSSVWAWGEDGHVIVGRIAHEYLTPTARAKIKELIQERTIADARLTNWADLIRGSGELNRKYPKNDTWHYINIEKSSKEEDFKPDESGNHVLGAIEKFAKFLKDGNGTEDDRREALMFVLHFMGDFHQPLHTCHRLEDRGANLQRIKSFRGKEEEKLNLHKIWDVDMVNVEKSELTAEDFAKRLIGEITEDERKKWSAGTVKDWVWDSHTIAAKHFWSYTDGTEFPPREKAMPELTDENYVKARRPIVREQLKKGGVRLAKILNDCFPEPKK